MAAQPLTTEQKEFFAGLMAGVAARSAMSLGNAPTGAFSAEPAQGGDTLAAAPKGDHVFGTPRADLCKQEVWKLDENPLDIWDKLLAHADKDQLPDDADTFRFRYFGLFNVSPAQNSLMLRCRIPAGELTSVQMRGLASIAEQFGGGYADVTTRSNFQIREIAPRNLVNVLVKLQDIGLVSRGSGVDNVRNITASPTAGID